MKKLIILVVLGLVTGCATTDPEKPHSSPELIQKINEVIKYHPKLWWTEEVTEIIKSGKNAIPILLDNLSNETYCEIERTNPKEEVITSHLIRIGNDSSKPFRIICENALKLLEEITGKDFGEFSFRTYLTVETDGSNSTVKPIAFALSTAEKENNTKLRQAWQKWWEENKDKYLEGENK